MLTPAISHSGGNPTLLNITDDCVKCHGTDGIGTRDKYPTIACQSADELASKMRAYVNGERKNRTMKNKIKKLSDDEIEALAEYYAGVECPTD